MKEIQQNVCLYFLLLASTIIFYKLWKVGYKKLGYVSPQKEPILGIDKPVKASQIQSENGCKSEQFWILIFK